MREFVKGVEERILHGCCEKSCNAYERRGRYGLSGKRDGNNEFQHNCPNVLRMMYIS